MVGPHTPFPTSIQNDALKRQRGKCGSCGTPIASVGQAGASTHRFGEGAEGHHVIPHQMGGPLTLENCIVLCKSCHYSVHSGGHWKFTAQYDFVKGLPMAQKISVIAKLYPHYR